jgi:hypothetical protein
MRLSRPRRCAFDLAALVEQRAEGAEQLERYEVGVTRIAIALGLSSR